MQSDSEKLGLPPRVFMYHLDQVATMLEIGMQQFTTSYVHYEGHTVGAPRRDKLRAINIAPQGDLPEWRIPEPYLTRWLKFKHIRFSTRGFI